MQVVLCSFYVGVTIDSLSVGPVPPPPTARRLIASSSPCSFLLFSLPQGYASTPPLYVFHTTWLSRMLYQKMGYVSSICWWHPGIHSWWAAAAAIPTDEIVRASGCLNVLKNVFGWTLVRPNLFGLMVWFESLWLIFLPFAGLFLTAHSRPLFETLAILLTKANAF